MVSLASDLAVSAVPDVSAVLLVLLSSDAVLLELPEPPQPASAPTNKAPAIIRDMSFFAFIRYASFLVLTHVHNTHICQICYFYYNVFVHFHNFTIFAFVYTIFDIIQKRPPKPLTFF